MDDVARLLARGQAARRVGETNMNRESSRSHSVFTCTLESRTTDESGITNILRSRLNLVDLAGAMLLDASFSVLSADHTNKTASTQYLTNVPALQHEDVLCKAHNGAACDRRSSSFPFKDNALQKLHNMATHII